MYSICAIFRRMGMVSHIWGELKQMRPIASSGDGFGTLGDSHIVGGAFVVPTKAITRGGPTQCRGFLLDRRCAEIHRVRRISASAECHVEISAADQATRREILRTELSTGKYDISTFPPPTECPMRDSFAHAPEIATRYMI